MSEARLDHETVMHFALVDVQAWLAQNHDKLPESAATIHQMVDRALFYQEPPGPSRETLLTSALALFVLAKEQGDADALENAYRAAKFYVQEPT